MALRQDWIGDGSQMLSLILAASLPCVNIATMPPQLRASIVQTTEIKPIDVPGHTFVWEFPAKVYLAVNVTNTGCIAGQRWLTRKQADELFRSMVGGI
jgi:hypothetical protein